MMIRPIVTNKERLSIPSEKINDPEETARIVTDMIDTASHYQKKPIGCVGLAANQIGELYNIILIWHEARWISMINPEMELIKGLGPYSKEGCLSRPGVQKKCRRNKKVIIQYDNIEAIGQASTEPMKEALITRKFSGYTARVIQHEMDHLRGVYI